MKSVSSELKPIVISGEVFKNLDEFHQALAIVLERRGRVVITDGGKTA